MNKRELHNYLSINAELYDLDETKMNRDEILFYFEYALEAKGPILEPMCGTGRFLIPFMEMGLSIEGFDASQSMLDILLRKCKIKHLTPKVWKGFLEDLNVKKNYELIFIPDSSFNLILSEDDIKISLINIYKHLNIGGKFVFELATLEYMKTIPVGDQETFSIKLENGKLINQSITIEPIQGCIASTKSHFELVDQEGNIEKAEIEETSLLFHDPQKMVRLLEKVGFQKIRQLKAFNRNLYADKEDKIIIFECIR